MGQCEHLTIMEREDITALRAQGKGINDIARETGRSKVAVSREPPPQLLQLRGRLSVPGLDRPAQARGHGLSCRRGRPLDDPALAGLVAGKIREGRRPPGQIAGRMALELGRKVISRSTTCRAADARLLDPPDLAGSARGMRSGLRHPESSTVTVDRGKELASFADVEAEVPGVVFCFCRPHSPWRKGTNENIGGLLREFFPKGTDFVLVTDGEVAEVYDAINMRPRKRLSHRAPFEVRYSRASHLL